MHRAVGRARCGPAQRQDLRLSAVRVLRARLRVSRRGKRARVRAAATRLPRRARLESWAEYNPADHRDELFYAGRVPDDDMFKLASAQDYVAQIGQGTIVNRAFEQLGRSDAGIALLRNICFREMEALQARKAGQLQQLLECVMMREARAYRYE
jgi:hypothetical protein